MLHFSLSKQPKTWLQIVDNLTDLKTKYNFAKNLLKDTNN
jgi:hypothetical protein